MVRHTRHSVFHHHKCMTTLLVYLKIKFIKTLMEFLSDFIYNFYFKFRSLSVIKKALAILGDTPKHLIKVIDGSDPVINSKSFDSFSFFKV